MGSAAVDYGPFHRLQSPTQTPDDARRQEETGELWGRAPRWGIRPRVKAYGGPLPASQRGIEFWTRVRPDRDGLPGLPTWTGPRAGVTVRGEMAVIEIRVIRNTQGSEQ